MNKLLQSCYIGHLFGKITPDKKYWLCCGNVPSIGPKVTLSGSYNNLITMCISQSAEYYEDEDYPCKVIVMDS